MSDSPSANTSTRHSQGAFLTRPSAWIHPVPGSSPIADGNDANTIDPPSLHPQQEPVNYGLSLPSDPGTAATNPLLLPIDGPFAGQEDPILEFSRFMNSAKLNMDWDALLKGPMPAFDCPQIQNTTSQLFTPDSTGFLHVFQMIHLVMVGSFTSVCFSLLIYCKRTSVSSSLLVVRG